MGWRRHGIRAVSRAIATTSVSLERGVCLTRNILPGALQTIETLCIPTSDPATLASRSEVSAEPENETGFGYRQQVGYCGNRQTVASQDLCRSLACVSDGHLVPANWTGYLQGCNQHGHVTLSHQNWRGERWKPGIAALGTQRSAISTRAALSKESPSSASGASDAGELRKGSGDAGTEGTGGKSAASDGKEGAEENVADSREEVGSPAAEEGGAKMAHKLVFVEDRSRQNAATYLQDLFATIKMRMYLTFHKAHVEKSFDEDAFLEEAKHAFAVVYGYFANGDFDSLSTVVAPPMLQAFKEAYAEVVGKHEEKGVEVRWSVHKLEQARLWDFALLMEKEQQGYGLQSVVPELEDYHDDTFLVLGVRLHAETWMQVYDQQKKLISHTVTKGWHTVRFSRQLPKLTSWYKPVEEMESPWYFVGMY